MNGRKGGEREREKGRKDRRKEQGMEGKQDGTRGMKDRRKTARLEGRKERERER